MYTALVRARLSRTVHRLENCILHAKYDVVFTSMLSVNRNGEGVDNIVTHTRFKMASTSKVDNVSSSQSKDCIYHHTFSSVKLKEEESDTFSFSPYTRSKVNATSLPLKKSNHLANVNDVVLLLFLYCQYDKVRVSLICVLDVPSLNKIMLQPKKAHALRCFKMASIRNNPLYTECHIALSVESISIEHESDKVYFLTSFCKQRKPMHLHVDE